MIYPDFAFDMDLNYRIWVKRMRPRFYFYTQSSVALAELSLNMTCYQLLTVSGNIYYYYLYYSWNQDWQFRILWNKFITSCSFVLEITKEIKMEPGLIIMFLELKYQCVTFCFIDSN